MVRAAWDGRSDLRQLNKTRRLRNRLMGIAALNHILQKPARPATSYKNAAITNP
jgi:hypothetical protein